MSKYTVVLAIFVFIGVAAAMPELQARTKRSAELKSKYQNLFGNNHNVEAIKEKLRSLENLLKRQGDGSQNTDPQNAGEGQNQGQDQGKGKGKDESHGKEEDKEGGEKKCGMSEEEHIWKYLLDFRTHEPVRELIDQMELSTRLLIDLVNECTKEDNKPDVFTPEDLQELKEQAEKTYNSIDDSFWAELVLLGEAWAEKEYRGKQAAENSKVWKPLCTVISVDLGKEIDYLNKAAVGFWMWTQGYFNQ